jgi:hypothetical protein
LFNEVWSNTKVAATFFGGEDCGTCWLAAIVVTGFTVPSRVLAGAAVRGFTHV